MDSTTKPESTDVKNAKQPSQNTEKEEREVKHTAKERKSPASGWITKFLKRPGNEWLEEVDRDYLKDFTNLMGLDEEICYMSHGLHVIQSDGLYLDSNGNSKIRSKTEGKYLEAAETLYGLLHARYILTNHGLDKVYRKYKEVVYGRCPRHYCQKTSVLPIGMTDKMGQDKVKIYCPSCEDVYHSSLPGDQAPDGAYYGTSLPQMFFMVYPALHPNPTIGHYVPRIYGFRIHGSVHNSGENDATQDNKLKKMDKNIPKSPRKDSRSKTKAKDKMKDNSKENDATQDNQLNKLPQINGHVPPEKEKTPRRRRRHKRSVEIEVE